MRIGDTTDVCTASPETAAGCRAVNVMEFAEIGRQDESIVFRMEASHFLWRMVRRITGVLVKLGTHQIELTDFERLLSARCERADVAAWTAPPSGLFLEGVKYRPEVEEGV